MSECVRRTTVMFVLAMAVAMLGLCIGVGQAAAATPVTSADGLWTWARPLPLGYPAGDSGLALAPRWVGADAVAAEAPGALYVATTQNDLLRTTDGGATWGWSRTSAVGGFEQPEAVDFVSSTEGWVAGLDATGENGLVLHTVNDGATWQPSTTLPGLTMLPGAALVDVRFTDPSSGFVVAGEDLETLGWVASCTTDGGTTWSSPAALPAGGGSDYSVLDAFAPSGPATAVCMETDVNVGGTSGVVRTYRTTDGGASWTETGALKGEPYVDDVAFSSPDDGWATGSVSLWHTTDGGVTWQKARSDPYGGNIEVRGQDIWIVGTSGAIRTTDGGATWTSSSVKGSLVSFADPVDGWVAQGAVYQHTTDGGATWARLTPGTPRQIGSLSAVPGGVVWGVAGPVVTTSDDGLHWRLAGRRSMNAVSAVSARQAWAVADHGLIVHTSDGGRHWTAQASHVSTTLASVDFADASHGWAGGAGGVILRTTDGGRHWHYTREAKGGYITQLSFAGAEHGIALGRNNTTFLVTHTGGRTWSLTRLPATVRPTTVLMEDASQGLIVAVANPEPQCFSTSDGGATWQQKSAIPNGARDYIELARSGSQLCAVSVLGDVATSSDDGATWSNEGLVMGPTMSSVQFAGADELMISGSFGVMTRDLATAPLP
jgi:photosystem II stability/assembly factor-like uncharacterized protein